MWHYLRDRGLQNMQMMWCGIQHEWRRCVHRVVTPKLNQVYRWETWWYGIPLCKLTLISTTSFKGLPPGILWFLQLRPFLLSTCHRFLLTDQIKDRRHVTVCFSQGRSERLGSSILRLGAGDICPARTFWRIQLEPTRGGAPWRRAS